jgi:hypothetical protein
MGFAGTISAAPSHDSAFVLFFFASLEDWGCMYPAVPEPASRTIPRKNERQKVLKTPDCLEETIEFCTCGMKNRRGLRAL